MLFIRWRASFFDRDMVPAHVRDLVFMRADESNASTGDDTKAFVLFAFEPDIHEKLHAETDSKKRSLVLDVPLNHFY